MLPKTPTVKSCRTKNGFQPYRKLRVGRLLWFGGVLWPYAGAKKCVEHMANGVFVSLPGLDHLEAYVHSDLLLPHVTEFLAGVNPV